MTLSTLVIADAKAETAPAQAAPGGGLLGLPFLILMMVVFYFLLIRPQTKRAKEHKAMVEGLAKGDEVVTSGGMVGKIVELGESFLTLEVAQGVKLKIQRHAVQTVLPKGTLKSD